MANNDAAFGMRPTRMIGGESILVDKAVTESPQTMEQVSSRVTWLPRLPEVV